MKTPEPLCGAAMRRAAAFTLIELLVVAAIMVVLIALLMPALGKARERAKLVICTANLAQIFVGNRLYAQDYRNYPDILTLGTAKFRRGPGFTDSADITHTPETLGMPALLSQLGMLSYRPGIWICPSRTDFMAGMGNTYAWSVSAEVSQPLTVIEPNTKMWRMNGQWEANIFVWDNWNQAPGAPGVAGNPSPTTLPTNEQFYPHAGAGGAPARNTLFLDGHIELW